MHRYMQTLRNYRVIVYPKSQNRTICEDRAEIKKQKVWRSEIK